MNVKSTNEIDIIRYLVLVIAPLCGWFGIIDWPVVFLFCLSVFTLRVTIWEKSKKKFVESEDSGKFILK